MMLVADAVARRVALEDGATDHHLDQRRAARHLRQRLGRDVLAVAQDGDGVAQREDLVELVRDVDDRDAAARSRRITPKSRSTSRSDSAAVGSSMMMTLAPEEAARAISTICFCATLSDDTLAAGSIDGSIAVNV